MNNSSPNILSDISVSEYTTRSKVVARKKSWSDLDLSLAKHPIRNDIMPLKDDRAIKNAVKNLLVSNFYERPFNPALGANLRGLLFEPADTFTKIALRDGIVNVITEFEPRVKITELTILDDADNNSYDITVKFLIKEFDTNESVTIALRRLR